VHFGAVLWILSEMREGQEVMWAAPQLGQKGFIHAQPGDPLWIRAF
jgi:hypothetical protein